MDSAFSSGVDSSLLVWAAMKYGRDWRAYYVHSAFQPAFELEDAKQVAAQCGMPLTVIEADIFQYPEVVVNLANRCYYYCFGVVQNNTGSCGGQVNEFLNMCG